MLNPVVNRRPLTRTAVVLTVLVGICVAGLLTAMTSINAAPQEPRSARAEPRGKITAREVMISEPQTVRPQEPPAAPGVREGIRPGVGNGVGNGFGPGAAEAYERAIANYEKQLRNAERGFALYAESGRYREQGEQGPSAESVQMLIKIFDGSQDMELKSHILNYLASSSNPAAREKLLSVARSESEPMLRFSAMDSLAANADFDMLVSFYDTTRDPEIQLRVLDYLSASSDPRVLQKLFSIAQSDPNPEMRRRAVDYIASR